VKAPFDFVIEPKGQRYNNTKKVGDKELILNTEIFNHQYVNRSAIVKAVPTAIDTNIKVGDEVIVHHNVFRRWHDMQGNEKNSRGYFNENTYLVKEDQIFLYDSNDWKACDGYCFVQPIKQRNKLAEEKEEQCIGVVKYTDGVYKSGELVGFTPFSTYEFIIDNTRLYRVLNKFITIKYEYQGNEETYNPSWAQSS
jgi:hypothetical protein|tara:strand:- start:61 stop:648 length:588 start_codon:yes stop_codon:yes gene_type:complete